MESQLWPTHNPYFHEWVLYIWTISCISKPSFGPLLSGAFLRVCVEKLPSKKNMSYNFYVVMPVPPFIWHPTHWFFKNIAGFNLWSFPPIMPRNVIFSSIFIYIRRSDLVGTGVALKVCHCVGGLWGFLMLKNCPVWRSFLTALDQDVEISDPSSAP